MEQENYQREEWNLKEAEQQQIWNATSVSYPSESCIHQLFEKQVLCSPDAVAVAFEDTFLSFHNLNYRANQLAHSLRSLGVGPEVLVGISVERSLEMIVGVLAVLKAGGAYMPLDPQYPGERLAFMLQDAQVEIVLAHTQLLPSLPQHTACVICLDDDWAKIAQEPGTDLINLATSENLAYVIYTSGSTGIPKGALVSHQGLCNMSIEQRRIFDVRPESRVLQLSSLNFDASIFEILMALLGGATLHLETWDTLRLGPTFSQLLHDKAITHITLTPSVLSILPAEELPLLRTVISAGEMCSDHIIERWAYQRRFFNAYGPTEATIWSSYMECIPGSSGSHIGRPIANVQLYVLDPSMHPLAVGAVGEIYIGGVGLARGYLNRPELTAERFVPHPFSDQLGARLYKTGDMARYLPDGTLEYLGRIDHQVKIRGFRIELGEIESVLNRHSSVEDAVVINREDRPGEKQLVAYLVMREGHPLSSQVLRGFVREYLPDYMVPVVFIALKTLPLTVNSKLDRQALPAPEGILHVPGESFVVPRTETERLLAQIWEQILAVHLIGIHENFFEIGGHSLNASKIMMRVRDAFLLDISFRTFFQNPTIAEMANFIDGSMRAKHGLIEEPVRFIRLRGETLTLSFAQQRLWFLDQWKPGSSLYNIPEAMRLRGKLDVATLEKSLQEVVNRHEILRTTFVYRDGEEQPLQQIASRLHFSLQITNTVTVADTDEREERLQQVLQYEAARPFDLQHGPLFRALLVILGAQEHVLLLTMHHIISDGWSKSILMQELTKLYKAFQEGSSYPLAPLPIQYADFALWQREWLQGANLERQIAYWQEQLANAPTQINLPTDFPRPPIQDFQGAMIDFKLNPLLSQALVELSKRENVTLFMMLLAAFQVLLWRYSDQEDLVIGTPIANRYHTELEGLIGFFVNTLVIRTDLSGNLSFLTLMQQVRETCLDAYAHQDLPFEKLVEVLQPERDLSRNTLFQVMFALQNTPNETLQFAGLTWEHLKLEQVTSKFDLSLFVWEEAGTLQGMIEYSTALFERRTTERLITHWKVLLESIAADPGQRLVDLPWISESECYQMLVEWNSTQVCYQQALCFHELFEAQVHATPDNIAVIDDDQQLTYAELNSRANQLARYLQTLGVGPEVLVSLLMERRSKFLVIILAIFKAGGAYLPLDPFHPPARVRQILENSGSRLVFASNVFVPALSSVVANMAPAEQPQIVSLENLPLDEYSQENVLDCNANAHLAYVIYTSGSTGEPKGAMVEQKGMLNHLRAKINALKLVESDAVAQTASQCFDISVWQFLAVLLVGGKVHIYNDDVAYDPRYLLSSLEKDGISIVELVPSLLRAMLEEQESERVVRPGLQKLRWMIPTGEALLSELARQWLHRYPYIPMLNAYGPTECSDDVLHNPISSPDDLENASAPIGKPIENIQVYVLDQQLGLVPVGVAGEIYIGGVGVGRGYLNAADKTANSFIPDQFGHEPGGRLYRTGDLARYLADGSIEYLGRIDHQVKVRGYRIELEEIEATLGQHPAVRSQSVLVQDTKAGEKQLIAYVVLPSEVPEKEVRSYLRERLPEYMVPAVFVRLEEMLLTPNGKIDRRALAQLDWQSREPEYEKTTPQTPLEQMLVKIWEQVLVVHPIGIHENFFELGGHSLLITQIRSRVRDKFQVEIPLRAFFENPTIADLALLIVQTQSEQQNETIIDEFDDLNQSEIEQILEELEILPNHEIFKIIDSMEIEDNNVSE